MDDFVEGEMFQVSTNLLDYTRQVESTLPDVWEDWTIGNGTTPPLTEDSEE